MHHQRTVFGIGLKTKNVHPVTGDSKPGRVHDTILTRIQACVADYSDTNDRSDCRVPFCFAPERSRFPNQTHY